jgi:hypothetical protein
MSSLYQLFFGPLDKSACMYFYFLSIIFFLIMVVVLFREFLYVVKNYEKMNFTKFITGLFLFFNIFLAYFVNRLMYTMCTKSIV